MLYLLISILTGTSLVFIFKLFQRFRIHTFQGIVFNYITCVVVGFLFSGGTRVVQPQVFEQNWVIFALALGTLFMVTFYLIALSTQKVGVTATSVATKISLVIPVLFSLLILQNSLKDYTIINYIGMFAALVAIVLSSLRPQKNDSDTNTSTALSLLLPFVIFINSGVADSLINYTNQYHLQQHEAPQFTMVTFMASAVVGLLILVIMLLTGKTRINTRSIVAGVILGIPNYFSIYFLIKALYAFGNDGAFLYPINNIGIILTGALGAVVLFREKLTRLNLVGLAMAVLALILISYQEIAANLF